MRPILAGGSGMSAPTPLVPGRLTAEQQSPVGLVGVWLGWAAFRSFGYAGFLLPLLLGAWGASTFVWPLAARGVLPLAGLGLLLVSAAGALPPGSTPPSPPPPRAGTG